jgi:tRNA-modifying protein YgfZ
VDIATSTAFGLRPRGFVGLRGPDAADFLQRMVSNEVEELPAGASCEALLLTAKARVIAPLVVLRRDTEDFLLLTEPDLAEIVRGSLMRMRFAAKVEIEVERHESYLQLGGEPPEGTAAAATLDYGEPGWEVLAAPPTSATDMLSADELERRRIEAGTPRFGREIEDRVLPAEAGLVERAISFTKGCYPGQEPIARLHYRGHANRGLRVLAFEGDELLDTDAELALDGKVVGRVTSSVARPEGGVVALAYVRREVAPDAELAAGERSATQLHFAPTRP